MITRNERINILLPLKYYILTVVLLRAIAELPDRSIKRLKAMREKTFLRSNFTAKIITITALLAGRKRRNNFLLRAAS